MNPPCKCERNASDVESTEEALVHQTLERVADKWTLLVIDVLGEHGEMRSTRLREGVGGVS